MTLNKKLWGKGDKFRYNGYIHYVKDVDTEEYYQTDSLKYYLCYDKRVNGRYIRHWVDADIVERIKKEKKK